MLRGNWNPNTPLESMTEEDLLKRHGYCKIIGAARETAELKLDWIWIDTCCIDKSSSAELQESINSMYRWYKDAEVCLIYLDDVSKPARASRMDSRTASEVAKHAFATCRWGKRGWTLQELIAPAYCRFYFQDWAYMGEKNEFLDELSSITGVPASVLDESTAVIEVSVAERMSWAAHRETTRSEDIAYCLLGLFDVCIDCLTYTQSNIIDPIYVDPNASPLRRRPEGFHKTPRRNPQNHRRPLPLRLERSVHRSLNLPRPACPLAPRIPLLPLHRQRRLRLHPTHKFHCHRSPHSTRIPTRPQRPHLCPRHDPFHQRPQSTSCNPPQMPRRGHAIRTCKRRIPHRYRRLANRHHAQHLRAPETLYPTSFHHKRILCFPRQTPPYEYPSSHPQRTNHRRSSPPVIRLVNVFPPHPSREHRNERPYPLAHTVTYLRA